MKYLVLFAKIVDDKDIGILMTGIYFGGICDTSQEADELARKCVSNTQGGTAIPRIATFGTNDLLGAVKDMNETFDRLAERMYENEQTVGRDFA